MASDSLFQSSKNYDWLSSSGCKSTMNSRDLIINSQRKLSSELTNISPDFKITNELG